MSHMVCKGSVCQTIFRGNAPFFNHQVKLLTNYLKVVLEPIPYVLYWRHRGFWNCKSRSWLLALVPFTLMLYVFSTSVKAFVFDSRFVFKSRLKQTVHIMAVASLFCAITLPIQCTTH